MELHQPQYFAAVAEEIEASLPMIKLAMVRREMIKIRSLGDL